MSEITLTRKNKPSWTFTWNETYNGYIYITLKVIHIEYSLIIAQKNLNMV